MKQRKENRKRKRKAGIWRRNITLATAVAVLIWGGIKYWHVLLRTSPFVLLVHCFFLYLAVVKLLYDNRKVCVSPSRKVWEKVIECVRNLFRPFLFFLRRCAKGVNLLIQRMGAEQELAIAEKRRRKLEIELSQEELNARLAAIRTALPQQDEKKQKDQSDEHKPKRAKADRIPPYSQYGELLMGYLLRVQWDKFTISQAQQVLHKRFGTVKLVLEELVEQQKLEHVRTGNRTAYRLASIENNPTDI